MTGNWEIQHWFMMGSWISLVVLCVGWALARYKLAPTRRPKDNRKFLLFAATCTGFSTLMFALLSELIGVAIYGTFTIVAMMMAGELKRERDARLCKLCRKPWRKCICGL